MDDVKVHYNSAEPARLAALAYTQGTDIHLAPGQEQHLPHEAWHVVQQKQGRVRTSAQLRGAAVSIDSALEREADAVGRSAAATQGRPSGAASPARRPTGAARAENPLAPIQAKFGFEIELLISLSRGYAPESEATESDYDDPHLSKQSIVSGANEGLFFDVTQDYGSGIAQHMEGRNKNTAIVEFVTHPVDEYEGSEQEARSRARRPMEQAAEKADSIQAATDNFRRRIKMGEIFAGAPSDLYLGWEKGPHDQDWQNTKGSLHATYGLRLEGAPEFFKDLRERKHKAGSVDAAKILSDASAAPKLVGLVVNKEAGSFNPNEADAWGRLYPQNVLLPKLQGLISVMAIYLAASRERGSHSTDQLDKNLIPLLIRHDLAAIMAQFTATERQDISTLSTPLTKGILTVSRIPNTADEPIFPAAPKTRRQFVNETLTGQVNQALVGYWGGMRKIQPEQVGPTGMGARPSGVVLEERRIEFLESQQRDQIEPARWPAIADEYFDRLRKANQ